MARTHFTSVFGKNPSHAEGLENPISKKNRVKRELREAGATAYGLLKFNSRYLHSVLFDNEQINGVIYGRFSEGPGLLNNTDRMVVATNLRIISLNHKPGYTDLDEFTYDVINGVTKTHAGPFAAVTLNTGMDRIALRNVNLRCAEKFVKYVDKRRLEFFKARRGL